MAIETITHRTASQIRDRLSMANMTQEQLSETTGIPMRTLARRLHKSNPSSCNLEELERIAEALDTSIVSLIAPRAALAAGTVSR